MNWDAMTERGHWEKERIETAADGATFLVEDVEGTILIGAVSIDLKNDQPGI